MALDDFALFGLGVLMMVIVMFTVLLAIYIYSAITLRRTAIRMKMQDTWLAWIPVGNLVLLSRMAKMDWWPILLLLGAWIPFIGGVLSLVLLGFTIAWTYKVCEARKKPGYWAILTLIPIFGWIWGMVMWGILAWGE